MRLSIHPLFILAAVVALVFSATNVFFALLIAVILHETAHIVVGHFFGVAPATVALTPFGGAVNLQTQFLTTRQKNLIYLAGPMASLLFTLLCGSLVWLFPVAFGYLEYLTAANFLVGTINLLPIYTFDGGKVLTQFVSPKLVLLWSNLALAGLLIFALVKFNFWLIFFAVVLFIQINWEYRTSTLSDKFHVTRGAKIGPFVRCAVLSTTSIYTAYQMINAQKPTEFVVTDCHRRTFYEADLEQWLINYPLSATVGEIITATEQ